MGELSLLLLLFPDEVTGWERINAPDESIGGACGRCEGEPRLICPRIFVTTWPSSDSSNAARTSYASLIWSL